MYNTEDKKIINKAIRYAKSFENYRYRCWKLSMGFPNKDGAPFWKMNDVCDFGIAANCAQDLEKVEQFFATLLQGSRKPGNE